VVNKESLYPGILFHFTSKEGLEGILHDSFSVSYAREKIEFSIEGKAESREFAVPMISFCDLRISELKSHMDKYGSYGIGLTKNWANKNGLNPVFYVNQYSPLTSDFIKAVGKLYNQLNNIPIEEQLTMEKAYMDILNTYRYIKNYEGDLVRKGGEKTENYRFADEREWRFVPPIGSDLFPFVPLGKIETDEQKEELNKGISHERVSFQPEDIKYLIVESDSDITGLIKHLKRNKERFDEETIQYLASRILTVEQIHDDV